MFVLRAVVELRVVAVYPAMGRASLGRACGRLHQRRGVPSPHLTDIRAPLQLIRCYHIIIAIVCVCAHS